MVNPTSTSPPDTSHADLPTETPRDWWRFAPAMGFAILAAGLILWSYLCPSPAASSVHAAEPDTSTGYVWRIVLYTPQPSDFRFRVWTSDDLPSLSDSGYASFIDRETRRRCYVRADVIERVSAEELRRGVDDLFTDQTAPQTVRDGRTPPAAPAGKGFAPSTVPVREGFGPPPEDGPDGFIPSRKSRLRQRQPDGFSPRDPNNRPVGRSY